MADPLIDLATVPSIPLHPAVLAARQPLTRSVADLLTVADASLDDPWRWRATDLEDVELRYGLYRIHERLEEAIGTIEVGRAGGGESIGPAVPPLAAMAAARWELRGALAPLGEDAWDAEPGSGEWTIRQTFGHIVNGQRSYGWYNAWYLKEGVVGVETVRPSEDVLPPEPTDEEEAAGSPALAQARLDDVVDANIVAAAGLGAPAMGVSARWAGLPVTIDFRLGRYGSHIREHTVQVDKTLAMLGRRPSEVERLVRLILASYGRLEGLLVGRRPDELERRFETGASAVDVLAAAMTDLESTAASVRAATSR
jgi:DinB superfamily